MPFIPSRHISDIPLDYPWEHPPRPVAAATAATSHPAGDPRRRRPRWLSAVLGALTVGLLTAGCSAAQPATTTGPLTAGEPQAGGTLKFGLLAPPTAPDTHLGSSYADGLLGANISDKLTYFNPATKKLEPWLAEKWTVSDDLKEYTFVIRDGVTFSDGTPLTAASVKENYDLLGRGNEKLGVAANTELLPGYAGATVTEPNTVTLRFDAPRTSILRATSHFNAGILASSTLSKTAEERGNFRNVVGSGPFVISAHDPQGTTVLAKRADYAWSPPSLQRQGAAYLDELQLIVTPEATARTGALKSGELDAILDVQPTDERLLKGEGYGITSALVPGKTNSFDILIDKSPTNELAVRKALQLGWNRDALFQAVLSDSYAPARSIASEALDGFTDLSASSLRYDQAEAKRLLDQAGWTPGPDGIRVKDGKRLIVRVNALSIIVVNKPAFELVQQDLRNVGIELDLHVLPGTEWRANRENSAQWHVIQYTQTAGDISVIDEVFSPIRTNISKVAKTDPGYQELVDVLGKLESTPDGAERTAVAKQAQELIVGTYALTSPIFNLAQVAASRPSVHGVQFDAYARGYFYNAWIDQADR
ncbi:MAG TPA: ABC transporter substrate-binding protein [Micropruina sp.]|nr:ABC transporter substrate-binding protein [Micropruina sp.]